MMEVVSVPSLEKTDLELTPCLITVREVTVLPVDNVDLLTLNPALTSNRIHLTGRKKTYSCAAWTVCVTGQEMVANSLKCY